MESKFYCFEIFHTADKQIISVKKNDFFCDSKLTFGYVKVNNEILQMQNSLVPLLIFSKKIYITVVKNCCPKSNVR